MRIDGELPVIAAPTANVPAQSNSVFKCPKKVWLCLIQVLLLVLKFITFFIKHTASAWMIIKRYFTSTLNNKSNKKKQASEHNRGWIQNLNTHTWKMCNVFLAGMTSSSVMVVKLSLVLHLANRLPWTPREGNPWPVEIQKVFFFLNKAFYTDVKILYSGCIKCVWNVKEQ